MTIDRHDLIGAWRLDDFVVTDSDGNRFRPYRDDSKGLLFYSENGFMSVGTLQFDIRTGAAAYVSYHGSFDLYDDRVVHHIEMSSDDGLVGRDTERVPVLDGDVLTLTSSPSLFGGEGTSADIVWRRAKRD